MHEKPAKAGQTYLVKQAANTAPATLEELRFTIDVNTMRRADSDELGMNDIGRARLTLHRPLAYDHYQRNRQTGNFILIDRMTNATVAAGMILDRVVSGEDGTKVPVSRNIRREASMVATEDREQILKQRGVTIWLTGLSGSGKSTIAKQLEQQLIQDGHLCYILDGDNIRHGLNRDLGFSAEERKENIRRIAEVAHLFNMAGMIAVTAFISPYRADREMAREIVGADNFLEVHVSTPIEVCEQRDPKSLYKKARAGEIPQFTGITDPYEAPGKPSLEIDASALEPEESVKAIIQLMRESDVFR